MKNSIRILLWIAAVTLGLLGLGMMLGALNTSGTDAAGRGLAEGMGFLVCLVAGAGVLALVLERFWRGWLWIAGGIVALPLAAVAFFTVASSIDQARRQRETEAMQSGQTDFGDQPALLAVAQAISKNDEAAIRATAKNVPDLQAAGREGKTLLYFAVDQALERPELVKAVEVLLSLGANPNYNNGQMASCAMWLASNGEVRLLRAMLDAGGDPNGRDFRGQPIILGNWNMTYFEADRTARFHLLLERGADINSRFSDDAPAFPGYTLLLYRTNAGRGDASAYADALFLLERGADYHLPAADGTTLVKMLEEHRQFFATTNQAPPAEFDRLWEWLKTHGALPAETGTEPGKGS